MTSTCGSCDRTRRYPDGTLRCLYLRMDVDQDGDMCTQHPKIRQWWADRLAKSRADSST